MNRPETESPQYQIGAIAQKAGLSPSTIRYYEQIGLLPKPVRVSGQRRYDKSVLITLKIIRSAQAVGWSLDEIRTLLHSKNPTESWKNQLPQKIEELDQIMDKLSQTRLKLAQGLDCPCETIFSCELFKSYAN